MLLFFCFFLLTFSNFNIHEKTSHCYISTQSTGGVWRQKTKTNMKQSFILHIVKVFDIYKTSLCEYTSTALRIPCVSSSCPPSHGCHVSPQFLQLLDQQLQLVGCSLLFPHSLTQHPDGTALLNWRRNKCRYCVYLFNFLKKSLHFIWYWLKFSYGEPQG